MTVEPTAHPSPVPLELVDGFATLVALPSRDRTCCAAAITPYAAEALAFSQSAHERYRKDSAAKPGVSYRAYASAIAEHERQVGRRAHSFELNVQVLPLTQRGVWWIGSLTIAVTDGLRGDVVAFDAAIHPIIAELAVASVRRRARSRGRRPHRACAARACGPAAAPSARRAPRRP